MIIIWALDSQPVFTMVALSQGYQLWPSQLASNQQSQWGKQDSLNDCLIHLTTTLLCNRNFGPHLWLLRTTCSDRKSRSFHPSWEVSPKAHLADDSGGFRRVPRPSKRHTFRPSNLRRSCESHPGKGKNKNNPECFHSQRRLPARNISRLISL